MALFQPSSHKSPGAMALPLSGRASAVGLAFATAASATDHGPAHRLLVFPLNAPAIVAIPLACCSKVRRMEGF